MIIKSWLTNSMKDKLDVFLLAERITDDEYKELMQMMED